MVFTSPAIFFRTFATRQAVTPDPSNLSPTQILEFDSDGETIIEAVVLLYQNNISEDPANNPDGTRRINKQDNGVLNEKLTITGKIAASDTTFIQKFQSFSRRLQIETEFHIFGVFGFAYPQTPTFDRDPDDTIGYTIESLQIDNLGQNKNDVPFTLILSSGGDLV